MVLLAGKLCDPCLSAMCVPWCKMRYINTLPSFSFKQDRVIDSYTSVQSAPLMLVRPPTNVTRCTALMTSCVELNASSWN